MNRIDAQLARLAINDDSLKYSDLQPGKPTKISLGIRKSALSGSTRKYCSRRYLFSCRGLAFRGEVSGEKSSAGSWRELI